MLLFELLDEKPTLKSLHKQNNSNNIPNNGSISGIGSNQTNNSSGKRSTGNSGNRETYKKIAWGFLMPVSTVNDGNTTTTTGNSTSNDLVIHVGTCDEWRKTTNGNNGSSGPTNPSTNNTDVNTSVLSNNTTNTTNTNTIQFKKICIQLHIYQQSNVVCRMQEAFQLLFQNSKHSQNLKNIQNNENDNYENNEQSRELKEAARRNSAMNMNTNTTNTNKSSTIPDIYFQYRRVQYIKLHPSNVNISICIGPKKLSSTKYSSSNMNRIRTRTGSGIGSGSDGGGVDSESDSDANSDNNDDNSDNEHNTSIQIIDGVGDNDGGGGNARVSGNNSNTNKGLTAADVATANRMKKIRSAVLKRSRSAAEPCVIPTKLLTRIDVCIVV